MALRMLPIHMVVASALPRILRKLSTCRAQEKETSALASRFSSSGRKATAKSNNDFQHQHQLPPMQPLTGLEAEVDFLQPEKYLQ